MRQRTAARVAIRVDERTLLAVPPMHPATPPLVRERVFEYTLRRQPGLAQLYADEARDVIEGVDREHALIRSLLVQTPHRNARGSWGAAA